ncbi:Uncharacterised protein [Enterobacter hormaechei]|nr:Uncharacterised protein [Enterobacter hormaechei]
MCGAATQIAEHQPHRRPRSADNDKERPEGFHKDVWQRLARRQRGLVRPQVCQPEHLQHPGDNRRAVDPGKPQQVANQHRQQDRRQRVSRRDQRFEYRHDGLWDQHTELRLDQQTQRIERQHHHQHRDQQVKRVFDHRRYLVWQADADIVCFQETHHLNAIDRHQNRGENTGPSQAIDRQSAFGFRGGDQQERHQRQHRAHERIQLMGFNVMFAEVVGDSRTDIKGHHPHRHIKRRQNLTFKLLRHIQPGASKTPGGIRRKRRVSEH